MPAPVQRYFRAVLEDGQPIVAAVWKPFTSNQRVVTRRPGFDWDGRVAIM